MIPYVALGFWPWGQTPTSAAEALSLLLMAADMRSDS